MALLVVGLVVSGWAAPAEAQDPMRALASLVFGTIPPWTSTAAPPTPRTEAPWQPWDPGPTMEMPGRGASPGGERVLSAADAMIRDGTIVRGSCYGWVDAVFTRAGGVRHQVFHGSITRGPYAQVGDFRPGDWVLFAHEGGVTHSAVFVRWTDEGSRVAEMMSYPGQRREEPGRYGSYQLTQAYRIIRMDDALPTPRVHRHGTAHASRGHGHHHG